MDLTLDLKEKTMMKEWETSIWDLMTKKKEKKKVRKKASIQRKKLKKMRTLIDV